jgi:hypothetical protein
VGLAPTGKRRLFTAHAKTGLMHRRNFRVLFEHLVSEGRQLGRHFQTERSGRLQVDDELEFGGLYDR